MLLLLYTDTIIVKCLASATQSVVGVLRNSVLVSTRGLTADFPQPPVE